MQFSPPTMPGLQQPQYFGSPRGSNDWALTPQKVWEKYTGNKPSSPSPYGHPEYEAIISKLRLSYSKKPDMANILNTIVQRTESIIPYAHRVQLTRLTRYSGSDIRKSTITRAIDLLGTGYGNRDYYWSNY